MCCALSSRAWRIAVFVAWRKVFPGDIRDVVVSTSRDGGQTFGPGVRVAADNWKLNGCPDSGPAILENDGRLYVAWLTEGTEDKARLRLAWSDDGANSFKPAVNLAGGVLDPNHPVFARGVGGTLLLLFQGRDGSHGESWSPIQAYLAEIRGTEMTQPRPVPNDQKSVSYPTFGTGTAGRSTTEKAKATARIYAGGPLSRLDDSGMLRSAQNHQRRRSLRKALQGG